MPFYLETPFTAHFRHESPHTIVIDAETEVRDLEPCVTVLGWYDYGEASIQQWGFELPFNARDLAQTPFFTETFLQEGTRLAAYNAPYETELFGVHVGVELMPRPFCAKESFIYLETLSSERGVDLPAWGPETYGTICFHNLSCVAKAALIYAGLDTFARAAFEVNYMAALETAMRQGGGAQ